MTYPTRSKIHPILEVLYVVYLSINLRTDVRTDTSKGNTAMRQRERVSFNLNWAYIHTGRVGDPIEIEHARSRDQD